MEKHCNGKYLQFNLPIVLIKLLLLMKIINMHGSLKEHVNFNWDNMKKQLKGFDFYARIFNDLIIYLALKKQY